MVRICNMSSYVKTLNLSKLTQFFIVPDKRPGPMDNSMYNYVKLSFKEGLDSSFITHLSDTVIRRTWELTPIMPVNNPDSNTQNSGQNPKLLPRIKPRTGIIGIERSLQEQQKATDENISKAFQDLKKLMEMAKDMVSISKTISAKIRVTLDSYFVKLTFIMKDHCRRGKETSRRMRQSDLSLT